jgi:chromosome segregation ATPase
MMTNLWQKVAGVALAGALLTGSAMTALAAEPSTQASHPAQAEQRPERQHLKQLRDHIRQMHASIVQERTMLKGKLETIKALVAELKQDPEKNQGQLEKARAGLRALRLLNGDREQVNEQVKAAGADLKAAIEAKEPDKAVQAAERLLSLQQTKLDLLRKMNNSASEIIAHLKAAD